MIGEFWSFFDSDFHIRSFCGFSKGPPPLRGANLLIWYDEEKKQFQSEKRNVSEEESQWMIAMLRFSRTLRAASRQV